VSPAWSPALGAVPCAALWYDARAHGRPTYGPPGRRDHPIGHHDG
jgi:hypothetical protein